VIPSRRDEVETRVASNKSSVAMTQVTEWSAGELRRVDDYLAAEEPLEIRVGRRALGVALRTPGNDRELVAGLLFTEGLIEDIGQVKRIDCADSAKDGIRNLARVALRRGVKLAAEVVRRGFSAGSACGACGKATIDQLRNRGVRRPNETARFDAGILCELPDKLRASQAVFGRTGGLHAAGLFDAHGELAVLREDIGRHNAVDKVIGWAVLQKRVPLDDSILLVSGRGGFEIVQKALVAGVPLLASVSAPSSLAVQMAREMGLTLVGFLRGRRFVIYAHAERLGFPRQHLL
jgi:FdhD protein